MRNLEQRGEALHRPFGPGREFFTWPKRAISGRSASPMAASRQKQVHSAQHAVRMKTLLIVFGNGWHSPDRRPEHTLSPLQTCPAFLNHPAPHLPERANLMRDCSGDLTHDAEQRS